MPFGKYPWYGNCEQKFSGLQNTCLCVVYYVEVLLDYNMQQMNYSSLNDYLDCVEPEILNHIRGLATRGKAGCAIQSEIARNRNEDEITTAFNVSFRMLLGPQCDLYNVTKTVIDLTGKSTMKRMNNGNMDLMLKLSLQNKECNEAIYMYT